MDHRSQSMLQQYRISLPSSRKHFLVSYILLQLSPKHYLPDVTGMPLILHLEDSGWGRLAYFMYNSFPSLKAKHLTVTSLIMETTEYPRLDCLYGVFSFFLVHLHMFAEEMELQPVLYIQVHIWSSLTLSWQLSGDIHLIDVNKESELCYYRGFGSNGPGRGKKSCWTLFFHWKV